MKRNLFTALALFIFAFAILYQEASAVSSTVRISQIYGGGGNTGATYQNDFVELFNASSSQVNMSGWSIQYAASTSSIWHATNLSGVINPGGYYLIQFASGGLVGAALPTPDAVSTTNISATDGKVALVNSTTTLSGACPSGISIIDLIGYGTTADCYEGTGAAPALSNIQSDIRISNGCLDTDNNSSDFAKGNPTPRNSSSASNPCTSAGIDNLSVLSSVNIWSSENKLYVDFTNVKVVNAKIEVFNLLGQSLGDERVTGSSIYTKQINDAKSAFIIVRITNEDLIIVKKLVVLSQ